MRVRERWLSVGDRRYSWYRAHVAPASRQQGSKQTEATHHRGPGVGRPRKTRFHAHTLQNVNEPTSPPPTTDIMSRSRQPFLGYFPFNNTAQRADTRPQPM
ncbi:hypothetical protein CBL_14256 [Carabus blaptoides fortunei]